MLHQHITTVLENNGMLIPSQRKLDNMIQSIETMSTTIQRNSEVIYAVRANTQNSSEILMRGLRSNLQDIGDCFEV